MCRSEGDLIPTNLTVSSFSKVITKTHGILSLEVDLGSKQIMLAFFCYGQHFHLWNFTRQRLDSSESLCAIYFTPTNGRGRITAMSPYSQRCRNQLL
ncbi:hypothetical protein ACFX19_004269 [Malus domestica]